MLAWFIKSDFARKFMLFFMTINGIISSLFGNAYTREVKFDTDVASALFSVHGKSSVV